MKSGPFLREKAYILSHHAVYIVLNTIDSTSRKSGLESSYMPMPKDHGTQLVIYTPTFVEFKRIDCKVDKFTLQYLLDLSPGGCAKEGKICIGREPEANAQGFQ